MLDTPSTILSHFVLPSTTASLFPKGERKVQERRAARKTKTALPAPFLPEPEEDEAEQKQQRRHDELKELALLVSQPVSRTLRQQRLKVHPEHASRGAVEIEIGLSCSATLDGIVG